MLHQLSLSRLFAMLKVNLSTQIKLCRLSRLYFDTSVNTTETILTKFATNKYAAGCS